MEYRKDRTIRFILFLVKNYSLHNVCYVNFRYKGNFYVIGKKTVYQNVINTSISLNFTKL